MTTEQRTMGEHNACGEGHIQVDVDRIPSDAYQKKDLRYRWLAALAAPVFTLKLSAVVLKGRGRHRVIVALAQNNDVLYRAPTASEVPSRRRPAGSLGGGSAGVLVARGGVKGRRERRRRCRATSALAGNGIEMGTRSNRAPGSWDINGKATVLVYAMSALPDATNALRNLESLLLSAPQGGLDPTIVDERVREVLQALAGQEARWIGTREARQLLGIASEDTVQAWAHMGLLRSRTLPDGRCEVRLDDVLYRRAEREGLMSIGGEELSPEELRILSQARPGRNPWDREQLEPSS